MEQIDKKSHRRDRDRAEREMERDVYKIAGMEGVRIVVDVGAYHGSFVRHAKKLYPACYIHAFEPDARNYPRLVESTKHLRHVYFHPAAMSGKAGDATFRQSLIPSCSTLLLKPCRGVEETTIVRCETLHDFMAAAIGPRLDIDILKLDCEGAEADILESITANDLRRIRYITGEWHGDAIRDRAIAALGKTHAVEYTTLKRQRGYFHARRRDA